VLSAVVPLLILPDVAQFPRNASVRTADKESQMRINRSEIVALLRLAGRHGEIGRAEERLPERVDSGQHGPLLDELGLDLPDLLRPTGGPNLSDRLGSL
jgi:hypothetical protein